MNVQPNYLSDVEKLDEVDTTAAALDLRDNGLIAAEFRRKFGLA